MFGQTLSSACSSLDSSQILEDLLGEQYTFTVQKNKFVRMEVGQVFIVYRGLIKLSAFFMNGDERILGLAHPSMPFGLPLTQLDSYEAFALTDVLLVQIDQSQVDQSPLLAQSLCREMTRRLRQAEALLAIAGERRVENRLRCLLKFLCHEIGQKTEHRVQLSIYLTHQQIAEIIGTSRVTITRLLQDFRREGWLNVDATRRLVISPDWNIQDSATQR